MNGGDAKKLCRQNRKIFKLLQGDLALEETGNEPTLLQPGKYRMTGGQCLKSEAIVVSSAPERVVVEYSSPSEGKSEHIYVLSDGQWILKDLQYNGTAWIYEDTPSNFYPNSSEKFTNGSCTFTLNQ